eukprot:TRINITY_DN45866_c0_g1_i1.p1 TRINITY_DN45866_c0_g1~~TRINITY_DN45866_c0_g1_i1.p1  ORF type:complete len:325 (+),score=90.01 TRINITY_DN45866_c0_g1_i1:144-1118(+)
MSDTPQDAPEHCPGTGSEMAGKSDACNGCPNQAVCASGKAKEPDPDLPIVAQNMSEVKHKVLVLSGKGGVGKSTVSCQLAHGLARDEDRQVGLLDIDICGPSVPTIMGLVGETVHKSNLGLSPVYVEDNLAVMSIGFLLADPDEAVIWRGDKKSGLIKQFLKDVHWSELDILLIDTPPGTSDEHLSINTYLKEVGVDGALIVSTPQEVALLDVRKEINFCRKAGIKVLGVIENMAGFVCPSCKGESQIFPSTTGGAAKMAAEMGVPFLGRLPLDPSLLKACETGTSFFEAAAEGSPTLGCLDELQARVLQAIAEGAGNTTQAHE